MNNTAANMDIRTEIDEAGVKMWQIAAELGVHQCTFSTWLRFELTDELKETVREAITKIKERTNGTND